jgi:hypothetical protein
MDLRFSSASHPQRIGSSTGGSRGICLSFMHQGCKEDRSKDCLETIPKYAHGMGFYLLIMDESKRLRKCSGLPEMTRMTEIRTCESLTRLYKKHQRQLLALKSNTCSFV